MAEICEEIQSAIDIAEVIGERVRLRRSSRGYSGLCPFHEERIPSFHVYTDTQSYYCFGCHESGNVFTYVMKTESVSFPEAVKILANRAGIAMPEKGERSGYELLEVTAKFYADNLASSASARSYLERHKLSASDVSLFGLGYANTSWDLLVRYLRRRKVSDRQMRELGLALPGRYGMYDKFRGRLIFPIKDISGRVKSFGGRLIDGQGAEYINSSEGKHLYLLDRARSAIREKKRIILVNGYMDAIRLHKSGFRESVAALGTSAEQARMLSRLSDVCYVCDIERAYELEKHGLNVYVIKLDKTPDEYLREHDPEEFEDTLKKARPLIEEQIYTCGRSELFARLSEHETYEVLWYKRQLSEVTGLPPSEVEKCILLKRKPSEAEKVEVEADYEAGLCALLFQNAEYKQKTAEVLKLLRDPIAVAILTGKYVSGDPEIQSFLERGEKYCTRIKDDDKWERTCEKIRERNRLERIAEIKMRMQKSQATAEELSELIRLKGESRCES